MDKLVLFESLLKASLVGGAGGAIYLANSLEIPNKLLNNQNKLKETDIPTSILKLEDINIYEKHYGCSYVFVKSWDKKETYNYLEFLRHHRNNPEKQWSHLVIKGADTFKNDCKQKKIITLSFNQRTNAFVYHHLNK